MTNYGAIAIMRALPENAPARQVRVLIALETFKAGPGDWRKAGAALLASTANVSLATIKRARPELIALKVISYIPGNGRGKLSHYRINIPDLKRGPTGDPLSDGKGVQPPPIKGSTGETDISAVTAGQAAQNGHQPDSPALSSKDEALSRGPGDPPGPPREHLEDPAPLDVPAVVNAIAQAREAIANARRR